MTFTPERNPYDGTHSDFRGEYAATTPMGRAVRQSDAITRLQAMAAAEVAMVARERMNAEIADRLARMNAEHQLNMQYLIQFGVSADARCAFQVLRHVIAQHGGLTLQEAANLVHARQLADDQSGNAPTSVDDSSSLATVG
ncbi:MAG: hypothetical protein Q8K78_04860 [Planctomycetaceae bacterium]|nr:hypothetical protein [Planctomycetaceae bacterium]